MNAPVLDGKHRAVAIVAGTNYHHLVFVDPCAEFTAHDGHHDAGEFYHVGLLHGFGVEFMRKPCRAEFIPDLLAWWHLDHLNLEWSYTPSAGVKRNPFWLPGDGSWVEAKHLAEVEALRTRAIKEITNTNPLVDDLWNDDLILLPHTEFTSTMVELMAKVDGLVAAEKAAKESADNKRIAKFQAAEKRRKRSLAAIIGAGVSERKLLS